MRKQKIYLDTSVVSYLYQEDAPEKMRDTLKLWEIFKKQKYEVYISDIVLNEIYECNEEKLKILLNYLNQVDYIVVRTDEDTIELAEKFIDFGILKQKSFDDCQHIAAAILAGCDIITSWNFKHIVNVKTVRGVKTITTLEGYKDLLIYPPSVLVEEDDDDE
ncbi:MAG: PIN domain-containing protein [Lachnospiraceae bacterium]|nr:PIN domain-containing protein [Lachnospiraceae bacterium]